MAIKMHILVCGGTGCTANASREVIEALNKELEAHDLTDFAKVVVTGCFGFCERGQVVGLELLVERLDDLTAGVCGATCTTTNQNVHFDSHIRFCGLG